jgi:hypothetical protein
MPNPEGFAAAIRFLRKNMRISYKYAKNNPDTIGSTLRWAAAGAGLGATKGAIGSMMGDDNSSVVGGAISGGLLFGGGRAGFLAAKGRFNLNSRASSIASARARGQIKMGRGNQYEWNMGSQKRAAPSAAAGATAGRGRASSQMTFGF